MRMFASQVADEIMWREDMIRELREALKFYANADRSLLGGFPWHCLDGCMTPSDCIMVGCLKLYLKDGLSKYAGQENTPALRKQMAADMVDLYRAYGEKKR